MPDKITVKDLQEAVAALRNLPVTPITLPLRDDIFMTYEGAVCVPGVGYIHPYSFRDIAGEEAYQEVINRPWKPSEYTGCDCPSCKRADEEENA